MRKFVRFGPIAALMALDARKLECDSVREVFGVRRECTLPPRHEGEHQEIVKGKVVARWL